MTRKETTEMLSNLLISEKLSGLAKYYAREVTLNFGQGKGKQKRIDFLQFKPLNQLSVDGIEKGEFICYEIKSCKEDLNSGCGLNFVGEKNYLVMTAETYKECADILNNDKKIPYYVGIIVAYPYNKQVADEIKNPTRINNESKLKLTVVKNAKKTYRKYSMTELLFYMIRSEK